jgi:hypothetical protein
MSEGRRPNRYVLKGGYEAQLTYETTSITGEPQLQYGDEKYQVTKRGDEIRSQELEIGTLVSIELEAVSDARVVELSLLVPAVNLDDGTAEVETVAVVTTERTSIGGPGLVTGQLQTYEAQNLSGTAELVAF